MSTRYRIDKVEGIFLLSAALAVDGLQALLNFLLIGAVLNRLISAIAFVVFWTWFGLRGVSFTRKITDALPFALGFLLEMVPFLDTLPATTLAVATSITRSRLEDRSKRGKTPISHPVSASKDPTAAEKTAQPGPGEARATAADNDGKKIPADIRSVEPKVQAAADSGEAETAAPEENVPTAFNQPKPSIATPEKTAPPPEEEKAAFEDIIAAEENDDPYREKIDDRA